MDSKFRQEDNFIRAKKRVKVIKGFYIHLIVYILINIFISAIIIFGLIKSGYSFEDAFSHFGVYSTLIFWGIGLFFHWLGVFGSTVFFGKNWERKQLEKYMADTKF